MVSITCAWSARSSSTKASRRKPGSDVGWPPSQMPIRRAAEPGSAAERVWGSCPGETRDCDPCAGAAVASDLHRDLERAASLVERPEEVDVVIGAGDFASVHRGLEEIDRRSPGSARPRCSCRATTRPTPLSARPARTGPPTTVLHGDGAEVDGTAFFGLGAGVPVTPWDWSFDLTEEEAEANLAGCPRGPC